MRRRDEFAVANAVQESECEMETRICLQIPRVASVVVKVINGYKKYILEGFASKTLNEVIDFNDHLFYNRSYFITTTADICLESVRYNESDFTTQLSFYGEETSSRILVPVPTISMKTSILSAYDLLKITSRERATALSNFSRFEIPVFVYLFFLVLSFTLAIGLSVFISWYRVELIRRMTFSYRRRPHEFRVFWRQPKAFSPKKAGMTELIDRTWRGFVSVMTGSSSTFKWISFLFSLLNLFMIGSYYGAFSTSNVIAEERHIIKTYGQLLKDPTALIYFYDQQSDSASLFRRSHANSLRGRVWRKLTRQPGRVEDYIIKGLGPNFIGLLKSSFNSMEQLGSVVITTTYSNTIFSWVLCGCSPEDELWRMIDFVDPSEKEKLEGWSVSALSNQIHYLTLKFRRLVDSGLIHSLIDKGVSSGLDFSSQFVGASAHHKLEQSRACIQKSTRRKASTVTKNIGYRYYATTSYLCFGLLAVAFVVLGLEKVTSLYFKHKKRPRRSKLKKCAPRRKRLPPFRPTTLL